MQGGVVLTVLGLVVLAATRRMFIPGVLVFALGAGLLISTAVSFQLSKRLGLLQERSESSQAESGQ
jgi:uncharacterized membrane protein YedE/YeeE